MSAPYRQLIAPPSNLVVERVEPDGVIVVEPVVAIALDRLGEVHLLSVDGEGFVRPVDFACMDVWIREKRRDEVLGVQKRKKAA